MRKTVAVITDATSVGFFFRKWHEYYGRNFNFSNLYVVTYEGLRRDFREFALGGLWEVPARYNDALRARLISSLTKALLATHDTVVRCDADEFLVPDPRRYGNLAEYVEQLELPYVTARGVDILEDRADSTLDLGTAIVGVQRRTAIRSSSLNKTCITSVPLTWSEGFHAADIFPALDELYLLHMKFADIKGRVEWFAHMSNAVDRAGPEGRYFSLDAQAMLGHQAWLLRRPRIAGWRGVMDEEFDERFLASVTRNPRNGTYAGEFRTGDVLFEIPPAFSGMI